MVLQNVGVDGTSTNVEETPTLPAASSDPKKAQAERKRLEKEEKEREKKRKQDEKQRLKEEAKQQKEKSNAPTRKQERDEKKQKSGIANFMSPSRQTARPKNTVRARVMLLDGSEIEVDVEVAIFLFILFVLTDFIDRYNCMC